MSLLNHNAILLAHGDGGALTHELIDKLFHRYFTSRQLKLQGDAAVLSSAEGRPVLTTDAFVVNPIFFPGGDIGKLSVCGTVNDLAVSGARPHCLTASFIIEEGLEVAVLEKVVVSMARACHEAGVEIVAGDTKVVERGHMDQLFITTTGLGWLSAQTDLGYHRVAPGDLLLVNGSLGDHGMTVLARRHGFELDGKMESDCAPLNNIIEGLLSNCPGIKLMRDLTRGGLSTAVKEIALSAGVDIWLEEANIPVTPGVQGAAQMLGLDPLYLANEGKFLAIVDSRQVQAALDYLRSHPLGRMSGAVGEIRAGKGNVYLQTVLGGTRFLDMMAGTPLPRIC